MIPNEILQNIFVAVFSLLGIAMTFVVVMFGFAIYRNDIKNRREK